ncbi:MAG: VOC family protein [Kineosporiaceae bacterium]
MRKAVRMIGRLEKTVIDCPDPRALAAFYAQLLGMEVLEDEADWVVIGRAVGWRELALQRAPSSPLRTWLDPDLPQQAHLDVRVPDVDDAEHAVIALAAVPAGPVDDRRGFRVFSDPAGHRFCLVFGGAPIAERPIHLTSRAQGPRTTRTAASERECGQTIRRRCPRLI